jgi:hypothetical protein
MEKFATDGNGPLSVRPSAIEPSLVHPDSAKGYSDRAMTQISVAISWARI